MTAEEQARMLVEAWCPGGWIRVENTASTYVSVDQRENLIACIAERLAPTTRLVDCWQRRDYEDGEWWEEMGLLVATAGGGR